MGLAWGAKACTPCLGLRRLTCKFHNADARSPHCPMMLCGSLAWISRCVASGNRSHELQHAWIVPTLRRVQQGIDLAYNSPCTGESMSKDIV